MPPPNSQPELNFDSDRETPIKWIAYIDHYGQRWLDDIGKDHFSQEYRNLFTVTLISHVHSLLGAHVLYSHHREIDPPKAEPYREAAELYLQNEQKPQLLREGAP